MNREGEVYTDLETNLSKVKLPLTVLHNASRKMDYDELVNFIGDLAGIPKTEAKGEVVLNITVRRLNGENIRGK